jgi:hypothetical protein
MKSPFEKKFCGKSPLKELTAKQEANLPEALKTAIEAKTDSPAKQIDSKTASKMADAASLEMRAKKRGISGRRQMQIDQENINQSLKSLGEEIGSLKM